MKKRWFSIASTLVMIIMITMGSFVIWAQFNYKRAKEAQTYVQAYNGKTIFLVRQTAK